MKRTKRGILTSMAVIVLLLAAAVPVAFFSNGAVLAYDSGTYTWVIQNPIPRGARLFSTSAAATTAVWSAGEYGTIMFWNGTSLVSQNSGTTSNLYGVDAVTTTTAFAVGENKTILYYNGTSWSRQTAPTPALGYNYDLYGVAATGANSAWAVGGQDGFHNAIILHRADAGGWHVEWENATGGFMDVFAYSASAVWAVGQNGSAGRTLFWNGSTWQLRDTAYAPISVGAYDTSNVWIVDWSGNVAKSSNGGVSYTTSFTAGWPASIATFNATNTWVVGWSGTIMYTANNGTSWSANTTSDGATNDLFDVSSIATTSGVFIAGDQHFYQGSAGASAVFTNRTTSVVGTNTLNEVSSYSRDNVWATGAGGYVVRSDDGGRSWRTQNPGGTTVWQGICAQDSTHVWVVGAGGVMRYWTGAAWTTPTDPTTQNLYDVDGASASVAWAVGGPATASVVIKTTNGGTNWSSQTITGGNRALYGVAAVDANTCWAVGSAGVIYKTINGGTNWSSQTSNTANDLNGVTALDGNRAWAVGNGGVIRYTSNGGANWQTQDVGGITDNLTSVSAADATHVWAVGANNRILFFDGTTWSTQTSPVANTWQSVFAYDSTDAWAVGNSGYIAFADPPYIKACEPGYGDPGETVSVKISGGYTGFDPDESEVTLSGAGVKADVGTLEVWDSTTLFVDVNIDAGAALGPRDVNVITGGEEPIPLAGGFVVGSDPTIASVSRGIAARGWNGDVEIAGEQTDFDDTSAADFGSGVTVNALVYTDPEHVTANVTVAPDAAPGPRDVNVVTGVQTPNPLRDGFTVAVPPGLAAVSRDRGSAGEQVTLEGDNFGQVRGTGNGNPISEALFNGVPACGYELWSDDTITCHVPEGATSGPVIVSTPDGASNAKEFTVINPPVPPTPSDLATWYLAEGSNAWGFETEIAVMNPNGEAVTIRPAFMTESGAVMVPDITLPANSSRVIHPGSEYGLRADFSTRIDCLEGRSIAVDRTMTWTGREATVSEGHSSIGVTAPATVWYLAEGSSAWGFECWLLLQNPNAADAVCDVTYMIEGEIPRTFRKTVPANSRRSFNMADDIGSRDASIKVESAVPVIPERSMYRDDRREGSCSTGTTTPSQDYYLAEGSTAWGFTTYVLIGNPNTENVEVTLTYNTPKGPLTGAPLAIPASSRKTVRVNDTAPDLDLSVKVSGSLPIVAERSMYWDGGRGQACHDSIGMGAPHRVFYLPGGQTGRLCERWYQTWTLVQNPNDVEVKVTVFYLTPDGERNATFTDTIPANSRKTYNMAERVTDGTAGVIVECLSPDRKIMSERSTYWDTEPSGRSAGTNTTGGFSD